MFATLCAKRNKKGFTLAELLIVVAIVAVLVAIAIPVFSSSLDKAKAAVDSANLRSAQAIAAVDKMLEDSGETDVSDGSYFNASTGEFQDGTDGAYQGQSTDKKGSYIMRNGATAVWSKP